ncbi:E3 ubiquitin-protein ligase TM129-like isoform X2 [Varroa jacobsoni]|nr:E3 ubiquitin-protein ligase TM129-like isoform X2 [Varroa destructor]XP_022700764.1 E3 ubiquitin-protein ligase TM129-like isoform X2 [Varroa jacobsoni]
MIASEGVWFSVVYAVFCLCVIAPPSEFVQAGLTISQLFKDLLGDETTDFMQYHLRRAALTTLIHSALPLGYAIGLCVFELEPAAKDGPEGTYMAQSRNVWTALFVVSLLFLASTMHRVLRWHFSEWKEHPVVKVLHIYAAEIEGNWLEIAARINAEFRQADKFISQGGITRTIVLRTWLLRVGPDDIKLIQNADAKLRVVSSAEHRVSHINSTGVQCLDISVQSQRPGVPSFTIRVNSGDYDQLRARLPLENVKNIPIHRNLGDRFIDAFKTVISQNPPLEVNEEPEFCIGCMQDVADVTLRRSCEGILNPEQQGESGVFAPGSSTRSACVGCLCRPLWCSSCLARWFVARQNQDQPHTWLMGKCPCPNCRSTFCLLDVRPLVVQNYQRTTPDKP